MEPFLQGNLAVYITYELPQDTAPEPQMLGAKEVTLPGPLTHWAVGEFENASGTKSYGVRLAYIDPARGPATQLVEVPGTARNVQVHLRSIPSEYAPALKAAA
jgi:hypothetical protein